MFAPGSRLATQSCFTDPTIFLVLLDAVGTDGFAATETLVLTLMEHWIVTQTAPIFTRGNLSDLLLVTTWLFSISLLFSLGFGIF